MIQTTSAVVYQGARRRYFSRYAAERSFANAALAKRCECEDPDYSSNYPGYTCTYHTMDPRRLERMRHLLVVMFVRKERA